MKARKGIIETERFRSPYRIYGTQGRTIVCVNGAQQTMAAWRSIISRFAKHNTVVVFDLPGQGRGKIVSGPQVVSMNDQVEVVRQVLVATQAQRTLLVGASWGAIIAASVAERYPELVQSLMLASFGVTLTPTMLKLIQDGQRLYNQGRVEEVAQLIIGQFGQKLTDTNKEKMREQFRAMDDTHARAFYHHCEQVASSHRIDEVVNLAHISAQTFIINGAEDTILDIQDLQLASTKIPNCETYIVEHAGHFLHWERDDILDIYQAYVDRIDLPVPIVN
jgi:pimeloyl-ACP methyl ester carboxylesterase